MIGQAMATVFPLKIFYDGSCRVCSAEMASYRRKNPQNRLQFVDISAPGFQPQDYGRTLADFMAELHVCDARGEFATGMDAFVAIWQAFPRRSLWRGMALLVGLPGIAPLSRAGYRLFARYRHLLPRRRQVCDNGSCNLH
jgi:predicted DCC family thiol-disulfide oxidoreductase YuxK